MAGPKVLLLDIETAPHRVYAWGLWDQNIGVHQIEEPGYTLCWAAKWYGEKPILWSSIRGGKKEMLNEVWHLINDADVVVHYNGTKFDIPTLNGEFLSVGMGPPSPVIQVDLLKVARKKFKLPSNKLDYVAKYLGIEGKYKHKGMALWTGCMAGNLADWKTMETYNKQDIKVLETVYDKLCPWAPAKANRALFLDSEEFTCPSCGSKHVQKRGMYYTKTLMYQRYQCKDCGAWSRSKKSEPTKELLVGVE